MGNSKIFSMQGSLWKFMERVTTVVVVNILVVLTSLPVVTIGASLAAGYEVLLTDPHDEYPVVRRYFEAFRKNWKAATGFLISQLAVGALLVLGAKLSQGSFAQFLPLLLLAFTIVVGQVFYPLLGLTGWTLGRSAKGSIGIALRYTFWPVVASALWVGSLLLPVTFPKLAFLWVCVGVGLPMMATATLLKVPFTKLGLSFPSEEEDVPPLVSRTTVMSER